jgi:hypothetical protein
VLQKLDQNPNPAKQLTASARTASIIQNENKKKPIKSQQSDPI